MSQSKTGQQMRITDDELALIKATFANNEPLLKLMRKMFLPEIDPAAPIGQIIDLWMTLDTKEQSPEDVKISLLARNQLIQHVEGQLQQLKVLAGSPDETPEETKERLAKNSSK